MGRKKKATDDDFIATFRAFGAAETAKTLGYSGVRAVFDRRKRLEDRLGITIEAPDGEVRAEKEEVIDRPQFPDDDIPVEQILDQMEGRFKARRDHQDAKTWFRVKMKEDLPVGVLWFGDPHLGNNGCNIPLIREHVRLCQETEGLYGANIGDTVDNWGGRLVRLYGENDVSRQTERKLAKWFLESVSWMVWLEGNHDTMDAGFSIFLNTINAGRITMVDWRAKFIVEFANGTEIKIDAAHNHKGHSKYNELHGQENVVYFDEFADLVIAGHHHTWAIKRKELPGNRVTNLVRVRGYKHVDHYADLHGFDNQAYGSAILTIFNPNPTDGADKVHVFENINMGLRVLDVMRQEAKQNAA